MVCDGNDVRVLVTNVEMFVPPFYKSKQWAQSQRWPFWAEKEY